jgi:plastocyanin
MPADPLKRRPRPGRLILPLFLACTIPGLFACTPSPTTHTVRIDSTRFQPDDLKVRAGDTVVWLNNDMFPHTATSQGRFDSGSIAPDKSWRHTVTERGEIDYVCTFHPTMKGKLRVE